MGEVSLGRRNSEGQGAAHTENDCGEGRLMMGLEMICKPLGWNL